MAKTFNRLLDNAIADAVSSYGDHRESLSAQGAQDLHERLASLADEQRAVLDRALKAFNALKVGNLGVRGATGGFLEDSLLPEIRLSSGMITPPKEGNGRNA